MIMKRELITGSIGTAFGVVGTVTQTNEILQTISLIVTIIGATISMIVVPIMSWHIRAKKDGKITEEEIKEGVEILNDGLDKVNDTIEDNTKKE